jgi:hypothetical protein
VRGAAASARDAGSERLSAPAACACGRLRRALVGADGDCAGHRRRARAHIGVYERTSAACVGRGTTASRSVLHRGG